MRLPEFNALRGINWSLPISLSRDVRAANRFLSADLSQSYFITRNFSAGIYYMYSHTLEKFRLKDLHYLAFRRNFMNIALTDQVFMKFSPQVYFLRIDNRDGFYFSEILPLTRKRFPKSVSSIVTSPIKNHIPANNHLVWNINLIYAFSNKYKKIHYFINNSGRWPIYSLFSSDRRRTIRPFFFEKFLNPRLKVVSKFYFQNFSKCFTYDINNTEVS